MNSGVETPMDSFRAWMNAGLGEPMRKSMLQQMERFWEGQRKWLHEYESFSRTLLERRHSAADAALDMLRRMGTTADGAEWAKCCSDWLTGSFTRVAEDGRDMIQEGWKMFADVSQALTEGMAEAARAPAETAKGVAEAQQSAARAATAQAAAPAQSAAEQGSAAVQEAARMAAKAAQRPKRPEDGARA